MATSKTVTGSKADGYTFQCPVTDGTCGADGTSFRSSGWPTRETAEARGDEHIAEHKGEGSMRSLDDFRAVHGLTPTEDGQRAVVTAKDL